VLEPTAQQVADRAGMTIRSVFRHFSDVESLFASLDARLQAEALPLLLGDHPSGSLEERTRALVQRRSAFFERLAPYKRSGNLQRRRSAFIERQHRTLVRTLRTELLRALPELKQAPADLIEAFDLATSFEAWDRLRSDQRLGRDRAAAVMEHNALALARELTR
jgi:AcrR family transcriptional regulator